MNLLLDMEIVRAVSWEDAIEHDKGELWSYAILEAQNALTMHLSFNHKKAYNGVWNPLAIEAREFIVDEVMPRIETLQQGFSQMQGLASSIRWNLIGAFMEDAYTAYNPPTDFFLQLLRVYEAGHLPCGWEDGEWPEGRLVVF